MFAPARLLGAATLGLVLLAGCGNDRAETAGRAEGADRPADSPSASATTELVAPTQTTSLEQPSADPVTITHYDAGFDLDADGDLAATETLTIAVSTDDRHGIYRTFDDDVAVEDFSATLDGGITPVLGTSDDSEKAFRIGDPDHTLEVGQHVVRLSYRVGDVLTADDEMGRRFGWLVIPDGWAMDISAAHLTVDLPAIATQADCTIEDVECDVNGVGTQHLEIVTGELEPHTSVQLQVSMPKL